MRARLLVLLLVVAVCLLLLPGMARSDGDAGDAGRQAGAERLRYVVQPGDTLWSIARRTAPGHDPRPLVDELIEENDLQGALQAGQELWIPASPR